MGSGSDIFVAIMLRSCLKAVLIGLFGLLLFNSGPGLYGQVARPDRGAVNPLTQATYYEDFTGELTFDDILRRQSYFFKTTGKQTLNLGYFAPAVWVRFKVLGAEKHRAGDYFLEIKNPALDHVDLYVRDSSGILRKRSGDLLSFEYRDVLNRNHVFQLSPGTEPLDIFIRVQSKGAVFLNLSLYDFPGYNTKVNINNTAYGLYYGGLVVMMILYLFFAVGARELSSFYYLAHIACFGMFLLEVNGLAAMFFRSNYSFLANMALPVWSTLSIIFGAWFTRSFLLTRVYAPAFHQFITLVGYLAMLLLFLNFFLSYDIIIRLVTMLAMLFAIVVILTSIVVYSQGFRPARFFVFGWAVYLLGILSYALFSSGLLPDNLLTRYGKEFGSVIEMTLMILALTDKITVYRREKEKAQESALEEKQKQIELRESLNVKLEQEVQRKTADLSMALDELQKRDANRTRELNFAAQIQKSILPGTVMELDGFRVASYVKYMTGVGGDYFDIFSMPGNRLGFLISDVSGHGVPAALVTTMAKISFIDAIRFHSSPRAVLLNVNDSLVKSISTLAYLSAFYFRVEPDGKTVYCGAGHPDPLVYRRQSGKLDSWDGRGFFIGCMTDIESFLNETEDSLAQGDRVLLYTDGIFESRNKSGESFDMERFTRAFIESNEMPLEQARNYILECFETFTAGADVDDDVSFLIVEMDAACKAGKPEASFSALDASKSNL